MIFGFGKKKEEVGFFTKLVLDKAGDDEFFRANRENEADVVSILYIALTVALKEAETLKNDTSTKKFFKNTSLELILCEYALFTIQQSRWTLGLEELKSESYDYEVDDNSLSHVLGTALQVFKDLGNRSHVDFDDWCRNRIGKYMKDPKQAAETFAFNLVNLEGKESFNDLDKSANLNLEIQLAMMAIVIDFSKMMIPAFIDSANTLLSTDF